MRFLLPPTQALTNRSRAIPKLGPTEFLASLVNSVVEPSFEAVIQTKSPEFQALYLKSLEVCTPHLAQAPNIAEPAAVHRLVEERIQALRALSLRYVR